MYTGILRNISVKKILVVLVSCKVIGLFGLFSLPILLNNKKINILRKRNYMLHILIVCKVLKSDRQDEKESKSGECALFYCVYVCLLPHVHAVLNTPAAGVQSSKLSAQPAAKGRTFTCLVQKKVCVRLV